MKVGSQVELFNRNVFQNVFEYDSKQKKDYI